jgi:hypothetical protein
MSDTTNISDLPGMSNADGQQQIQNVTLDIQQSQQQMPGQQMPGQQMPGQQMPGQQMPGQQMPGQQMPSQIPTQQIPMQTAPPFQQDGAIHQSLDSQLERAAHMGSLQLPSRDIPQTTNHLLQDEHTKPDYIPENKRFIEEWTTREALEEQQRKSQNREDSIELIYHELQFPIFAGLLYFIFQLPFMTKLFHRHFTFGYHSDGAPNLYGFLVKTFFFTGIFYTTSKLILLAGNM